jgi:N utilization substance protein A
MGQNSLVDSFAEFKTMKNIDRPTLMKVMESVFKGEIKKMYGGDENFDIIVNDKKGDLEIWRNRRVVPDDEVSNPNSEISLSDAHLIDSDYELGDEVMDEVDFRHVFGRRTILSIRQNISGKVQDLEKINLYEQYRERIGELIVGEVHQSWKREAVVMDDDGNELLLPKTEQIPNDFLRKGDTVRAVVQRVEMENNKPIIILSRITPEFVERLFELEVPEILDRIITIKKIVRQPGERAKVLVESGDERIDPVGACVGMKGSRIHGIVRELRNENIDVINFTNNTHLLVQRALNPAKISSVKIDEENKRIHVYMPTTEISMAIGRGGVNIRLAGQLVGYEIDVFRDGSEPEEEDVSLDEFKDEIEEWIIAALKGIGCDTAKNVLKMQKEDLISRTDLEEETINHVLQVLAAEFEDDKEEKDNKPDKEKA